MTTNSSNSNTPLVISPCAWLFERELLCQSILSIDATSSSSSTGSDHQQVEAECASIASLLQKRPPLARERFPQHNNRLPLHLVCNIIIQPEGTTAVSADACHDLVKLLLELYPDGIAQSDEMGLLPIHILMNGFHDDNSTLLLQPILQTLLSAYPCSAAIRPGLDLWRGLSPLEVSYAKNCGFEVQNLLLESITSNDNDLQSFYLTQDYNGVFTMELAHSVCDKILSMPQLNKLECHVRNWDGDAFLYWLQCLACRTPQFLTSIGCWTVPAQWIFDHPCPSLTLIQQFMENSTSHRLQTIKFMVPYGTTGTRSESDDDPSEDSRLVEAIHSGLARKTTTRNYSSSLEELELENFVIMNNAKLGELLAQGSFPRKLQLTETVIANGQQPSASIQEQQLPIAISKDSNPPLSTRHNGVTEDLQFTRCPVATDSLIPLFENIAQMKFLQQLSLGFCNYRPGNEGPMLHTVNLTCALIAILNQTPLVELEVQGGDLWIDIGPVCRQALNCNTTLTKYHVHSSLDTAEKRELLAETLQYHNTTLQDVDTGVSSENYDNDSNDRCDGDVLCKHAAKIYYWTLLNRFGRGVVRKSEHFTKSDLVNLLVQASKPLVSTSTSTTRMNDQEGEASDDSSDVIFNAHFGLLKENPNLWCFY